MALGEVGTDDGGQAVTSDRSGRAGIGCTVAPALCSGRERGADGFGNQRRLAGEVAIECAMSQAGGTGDVGDADATDAAPAGTGGRLVPAGPGGAGRRWRG
jgi:hypothetical protein